MLDLRFLVVGYSRLAIRWSGTVNQDDVLVDDAVLEVPA